MHINHDDNRHLSLAPFHRDIGRNERRQVNEKMLRI